jgi:hypothetical protein
VKTRILELRAGTEQIIKERVGLSRQWVLDELRNNHDRAVAKGNTQSANRSLELIGKALGMFVDRTEGKQTITCIEEIPDAVFRDLLERAERAAALATPVSQQ